MYSDTMAGLGRPSEGKPRTGRISDVSHAQAATKLQSGWRTKQASRHVAVVRLVYQDARQSIALRGPDAHAEIEDIFVATQREMKCDRAIKCLQARAIKSQRVHRIRERLHGLYMIKQQAMGEADAEIADAAAADVAWFSLYTTVRTSSEALEYASFDELVDDARIDECDRAARKLQQAWNKLELRRSGNKAVQDNDDEIQNTEKRKALEERDTRLRRLVVRDRTMDVVFNRSLMAAKVHVARMHNKPSQQNAPQKRPSWTSGVSGDAGHSAAVPERRNCESCEPVIAPQSGGSIGANPLGCIVGTGTARSSFSTGLGPTSGGTGSVGLKAMPTRMSDVSNKRGSVPGAITTAPRLGPLKTPSRHASGGPSNRHSPRLLVSSRDGTGVFPESFSVTGVGQRGPPAQGPQPPSSMPPMGLPSGQAMGMQPRTPRNPMPPPPTTAAMTAIQSARANAAATRASEVAGLGVSPRMPVTAQLVPLGSGRGELLA